MKLKTVLVLSLTLFVVFIIYLSHIDKKVYYVTLGDYQALGLTNEGEITYGYTDYLKDILEKENKLETYIIGYAQDDARITDLMNDIEQNKKIQIKNKTQTLKNALIKADLVTLSIGMNDLFYKIGVNPDLQSLNYNEIYYHVDEMMEDMESLFELLREYCKEDIIMTNFYNSIDIHNQQLNEVLSYANKRLDELADTYQISVVEMNPIFRNRPEQIKSIYPTQEEYQKISKQICEMMYKTLLKK